MIDTKTTQLPRSKSGKFISRSLPNEYIGKAVPVVGIYKITSPKGDIYIGQSRDIYERWWQHEHASEKTAIPLLKKSFDDYGSKNHVFEIIHQLPNDIEGKTLLQYEELYIDLYLSVGASLMNRLTKIAGWKQSQESKNKIKNYWESRISHAGWAKNYNQPPRDNKIPTED
jgi:group I intron endonuclease